MNPPTATADLQKSPSSDLGRFLFLCVAVGVIAGLGAIGFFWLLEVSRHFFLDFLAGYRPMGPGGEAPLLTPTATPLRLWVLFLVPALGGLLSGCIVYWLAPEAAGHGTDAAIEAYHFRQGAVRARVPFVKAIASAITIGSGGSGGREGPIAQIGAGFGSVLAKGLKLSPNERRTLMAAGMAAGIGAIFHAPLAGALFAAEVLYRETDLEHEVLVPAFISSIVAYSIFAMWSGWTPIFVTPDFVFETPVQLIPYLILAVVVAGGALVFIRTFYFVRDLFAKLAVPGYLKPAIGGLAVGLIALLTVRESDSFSPIGTGYGVIQEALTGEIAVGLLLLIAIGKIVTTSFSIGSGGSGGVFGPAIVIGGALGGVVGKLAQQWLPDMDIDAGSFVVVGMGAFFAGVANAPIASLVMVAELTGAYELLPPLMVVAVLALITSRRWSIYTTQVDNKFSTRAHLWEMNPNILKRVTIGDVMRGNYGRSAIIPHDMPLARIEAFSAESGASDLLLLDDVGGLAGLLSLNDLGDRGELEHVSAVLLADDLVNRRTIYLSPQDNLIRALEFFGEDEFDKLPIVESTDGHEELLGYMRYKDIIAFYKREHD